MRQQLKLVCPSCGSQNEPGERFCGNCGAALAGHVQPGVEQSSPRTASTAPEIHVSLERPEASTMAEGER
jgi:predicted amidophosphoribosyltransferase